MAVTLLQVGEGRFLRAFLGPLLADLRERRAFAGQVILTAPRPSGAANLARLVAQGGRYRVHVRGPQGTQTQELAPYDQIIDGGSAPRALLAAVAGPDPLIVVSNTTEAGLEYRGPEPHGTATTYPARLAGWLVERERRGHTAPVAVLPCELVQANGTRLRDAVRRHLANWGLGPAALEPVVFCDTLVDRIVTSEDPLDALACFTEPFAAWYIAGAPDWVRAALPFPSGWVHWVDDLAGPHARKVRLLNGTHTLMAVLGLQLGVTTVAEALGHPVLGPFLRAALFDEGVGSFAPADRPEARAFGEATLARLMNPGIRDPLARLTLQLSAKVQARWEPIFLGYHEQEGRWPRRFALGLAAYLRLLLAERPIDVAGVEDPSWAVSVRVAVAGLPPAECARRAARMDAWPAPRAPELVAMVAAAMAGDLATQVRGAVAETPA